MAHSQDYADRIIRARDDLQALLRDCPHNIDPSTFSARCTMCGETFGWHCPASPDHVCHYYTVSDGAVSLEDGCDVRLVHDGQARLLDGLKVRLLDGSNVDPPADHDPEYETEDSCIYCGQPEERK